VSYLATIFGKIVFIMLIIAVGVFIKRAGMISDNGERDVSRLMVDLCWPSLIFTSIVGTLQARDILDNAALPLLAVGLHLAGFLVGSLIARPAGFTGARRNVFLFHSTMNNFFVMALPFAAFLLPEKGVALLTVCNLGSTVMLWSVGVTLMAGRGDLRATMRNVLSPAMVATLLGAAFVLTGLNRFIPALLLDVGTAVGTPTLFLGLLIAGTQISRLGVKALKFDLWNILVGLTRNFLVPGLAFAASLFLRGYLTREALIVFMLIAIAPASVNSITLALRYNSSSELASEGVLFTHLLAGPSMVFFMFLVDRYLMV